MEVTKWVEPLILQHGNGNYCGTVALRWSSGKGRLLPSEKYSDQSHVHGQCLAYARSCTELTRRD
jgi:hypothetical protein